MVSEWSDGDLPQQDTELPFSLGEGCGCLFNRTLSGQSTCKYKAFFFFFLEASVTVWITLADLNGILLTAQNGTKWKVK